MKKGFLPAGADVAHGTTLRCDAALRPCGRARVTPRDAQVALTRGRRPRGRVHMGAVWGATCTLVIEGDGDDINRGIHPPI